MLHKNGDEHPGLKKKWAFSKTVWLLLKKTSLLWAILSCMPQLMPNMLTYFY